MGKKGFIRFAVISFLLMMFLLFLFLKSIGVIEITGFTTNDLGINDVILTKISIESDGSVEPVLGNFYKYDNIGCVINYNLANNTNLSVGFFSIQNSIENPNKIYYDVFHDTVGETVCRAGVCLAYLNVTNYIQGNWLCFTKVDNSIKPSNELRMANGAPILKRNINNIHININGSYAEGSAIDLDNYFIDLEGDELEYGAVDQLYIMVSVDNNGLVTFTNPDNFEGYENIKFRAHDGLRGTFSNNVTVLVGQGTIDGFDDCNPAWDCNWGSCINSQQSCIYFDRNSCDNAAQKPSDLVRSCDASINTQQTQGAPLQLTGILELEKPSISGTKRTLLIVGIVVLAFSLVGFGAYLLLRKKPVVQQEQKPIVQQMQKLQSSTQVQSSINSELQKYIEAALQQGQTEQKIKIDLLKVGWAQKDIDYNFNYFMLKRFVRDKLNSGFTKEKIIQSLKAKGWKEDLISNIFKELEK